MTCVECGAPLPSSARRDARYCFVTCRVRAYRRRHGQRDGWGNASDRRARRAAAAGSKAVSGQ